MPHRGRTSEVTTLSRFPIRRYNLKLGVAYKENIDRVREILLKVAEANALCLDELEPLFIFTGFGDSTLEIQFSVWSRRENFLALRNAITSEITAAFDAKAIEIPFPRHSLYAGAATRRFPLKLMRRQSQTAPPDNEHANGQD